jgi:hypothetical protein
MNWLRQLSEAVRLYDMNGRSQIQGGEIWILSKEIRANRFFCYSHWLENWNNHFCPSMGPNGRSMAMDSGFESKHVSEIHNGRHKKRSGPPKNIQYKKFSETNILWYHFQSIIFFSPFFSCRRVHPFTVQLHDEKGIVPCWACVCKT